MAKVISNEGQWKQGQSGNPKGRPRRSQALTQMLRATGDSVVRVGGQPIQAHEALARAVWQFVLKGEVRLMGKHLEATSVTEWASVVKWLYAHVEPSGLTMPENEPEMIVRVLREDRVPPYANAAFGDTKPYVPPKDEADDYPHPLTASASPLRREGEQEENEADYPHPPAPSPLRREGEQDNSQGGMGGTEANEAEMITAEDLIPQVLLSGGDDVSRLELESSEEDWL